MEWLHPTERPDATEELKALARAWRAHMTSYGAYGEEDREIPQWAVDTFAEFSQKNPDFDAADCMLPEWLDEKREHFARNISILEATKKEKAASLRDKIDQLCSQPGDASRAELVEFVRQYGSHGVKRESLMGVLTEKESRCLSAAISRGRTRGEINEDRKGVLTCK